MAVKEAILGRSNGSALVDAKEFVLPSEKNNIAGRCSPQPGQCRPPQPCGAPPGRCVSPPCRIEGQGK